MGALFLGDLSWTAGVEVSGEIEVEGKPALFASFITSLAIWLAVFCRLVNAVGNYSEG